MESMSERDRYIGNPMRLLRCAVELATMAIQTVDDAQDVWSEERYPSLKNAEAPCATEEELMT